MRLFPAFLLATTLVACSGGDEEDTGKTRPPKEEEDTAQDTDTEPLGAYPLTGADAVEEAFALVQMPLSVYFFSAFSVGFGDGVCPELLASSDTEVHAKGDCTASDGTVYTGTFHVQLDARGTGTVVYENWGSSFEGEGLTADGTHAVSANLFSATGDQSLTVEVNDRDEAGAIVTHAGTWSDFEVAATDIEGTYPYAATMDIVAGERIGTLVSSGSVVYEGECPSPVGGEVVLSGTQDVTLTPDGCSRGGCIPWTAEDGTTGEVCL